MKNPLHAHLSAGKFAVASVTALALGAIALWYRRPIPTWQSTASEGNTQSQITKFLPKAEYSGEASVVIHAPADAIFSAIRKVTLADMPIANLLGSLRYLPAKSLGSAEPETPVRQIPFLEVVQTEGGNIILAEQPDREIVIGAIGKFHNLMDQQVVPLRSAADFIAFNQPDYQKLAMSFLLSPTENGSAYRLSLIHGTHGLSRAASLKFALYWLGIKPGGNFVSWLMLRAIRALAEHQSDRTTLTVPKL